MSKPLLKLGDTATWRTYPAAKAGPLFTGIVRAIVPAGVTLRDWVHQATEDVDRAFDGLVIAARLAFMQIGTLDSCPSWDRYVVLYEEKGHVVWRTPAVGLVDLQQAGGGGA